MFGFLGKHQGVIEITASGSLQSGTQRHFRIGIGSNLDDNHGGTSFLLFDIDNASATKPDLICVTGGVTEPFTGQETSHSISTDYSIPELSSSSLYSFELSRISLGNAEMRGWTYNSIAALSPANRKYKFVITEPEFIEAIYIASLQNNQGRTVGNTNAVNPLVINGNQFPNLKAINIEEVVITGLTLNVDLNNKLERFHLAEANGLSTINGKLPSSVRVITIGETSLTNVNTFIEDCVNCENLFFAGYSPAPLTIVNITSTLTGTLDISHMTKLKEFFIHSMSSLSTVLLPSVPDDVWRVFHVSNCDTAFTTISDAQLNQILDSSNLQFFGIWDNNRLWSKSFIDSDISNLMTGLYVYGNRITGNFTIVNPKPQLKDLRLGLNQNELNRFANINLSGLSGGSLTTLHLQGLECENLQLPATLPNLTDITIYDNKLSITTNPDLLTKINGYTSLINVHLSNTGSFATTRYGQDSLDGLGNNPDFSGLVNMTQFNIAVCKISGSIVLPNINKLLFIDVSLNTGLTSITNISSHTGLQTLRAVGCPNLTLDINTGFTDLFVFQISDITFTNFNLSNRTTTSQISSFQIEGCSFDTGTVIFPGVPDKFRLGNGVPLIITESPTLTNIQNLEFITFSNYTTGSNSIDMTDNALNITFPFGVNSFIPKSISIQNNGMSVINVDATINNIYTERTKWNTYTTAGLTLNISGTNSAPTGTYQAPAGFVQGSNDGTPASAKEQVYVLVNNYSWTITMN